MEISPPDSRQLLWRIDTRTEEAALRYPIQIKAATPAWQFGEDGVDCGFHTASWNNRVVQPAQWPSDPVKCSPGQIMAEFQRSHYTQALAMIACWGLMWRQPKAIWGERKVESIEETLKACARSIQETNSIETAWTVLTGSQEGQLGWTAVITSKTLHFLCRSMGFEENPPAAIDGRVIRDAVWPAFRDSIPVNERPAKLGGQSVRCLLQVHDSYSDVGSPEKMDDEGCGSNPVCRVQMTVSRTPNAVSNGRPKRNFAGGTNQELTSC